MDNSVLLDQLFEEIRALSHSGLPDMENSLERFLEQALRETPFEKRLILLEKLAGKFIAPGAESRQNLNLASEYTPRLLTLLLGNDFSASEYSPAEISEKFVHSLNTVFDTLNQIINVIHSTLLGQKPELETIRHIIGSQIEGEGGETSLQMYLDQIQQAFLTAHKAFQQASRSIAEEMLSALDPDVLADSTKQGLKFGPLRKAELFDSYQEKYRECRLWFESGHFSEKLLREFEKNCRKRYKAG
jgi:hypothetical protein